MDPRSLIKPGMTLCPNPYFLSPKKAIFASMIASLKKFVGYILLVPVYFYRWFISPLTGPSCRHTPTCSQYAIDVLKIHGPLRGLKLGTNRFLRCRPGGTHGYDPAPMIWIRKYKPWMTRRGKWKTSNRLKDLRSGTRDLRSGIRD